MKTSTSLLVFSAVLVEGFPLPKITPRVEPRYDGAPGTGALGRVVYGIISMICLCGLAFALGLRVKQFERKRKLKFAWILSQIQTVLALALVISGAILVYGLNLTTYKQCRASITVCLFLYFSSKILLYIFYLERVHIARLPDVSKRTQDKIWIAGMIIAVGFFGGMALWCLATPHAKISLKDGHCLIGSDMIPSYITFSFDIIINIGLTFVFCWLIMPILKNQERGVDYCGSEESQPSPRKRAVVRRMLGRGRTETDDRLAQSIKKMLKRNIIGSALTFVAGSINLIIYFVDATSQIAYVCYTLCVVDVVFGVLVVHWLTFGSNAANGPSLHSTMHSMRSTITPFPGLSMPDPVVTHSKASI
ncbi:hypothetical protein DM02DRAFT_583575 [Periconia macrospinosa]|uniref:G-protein coupled receptors family 3 profile domain-containing protein n=1 Tax=Periconia macrospinosa TaxID=97972 RepID=A0A2V1E9R7_9PLEO|nr:hypothetical protein DM02DRAFT_583575 [Periconia macrospinosa]